MFEKLRPDNAYNIYILIGIDNMFYECFKDQCKQSNLLIQIELT